VSRSSSLTNKSCVAANLLRGQSLEASGIIVDVRREAIGNSDLAPRRGIRADVIEAFNNVAGYLDVELAAWLREGAPLGMNRSISPCGVFPLARDSGSEETPRLMTELSESWANCEAALEAPCQCKAILEGVVAAGGHCGVTRAPRWKPPSGAATSSLTS
jgi:hypothetical protein